MSNLVALTNIRHGEEDGSVTEVAYGESVEDLPQDVIDDLTAKGLIGPKDISTGVNLAEEELELEDAKNAKSVENEVDAANVAADAYNTANGFKEEE